MSKHLQQITAPLHAYLAARFRAVSGTAQNKGRGQDHDRLFAPLEVAFLRGEALFRERFFQFLERRNIQDPASQLFFYQQFQNNGEILGEVARRTQLLSLFRKQCTAGYLESTPDSVLCYQAFCSLLWDLKQHREHILLQTATDQLFHHFAATLFPAQGSRTDLRYLKREIISQLARRWHLRPAIKESFKTLNPGTAEEEISFSLIAKIQGYHPYTLLTLEGRRLKTTRLKAYQGVHDALQHGSLKLQQPSSITPVKSRA